MIRFHCENCETRIKVPDGSEGRKVKCPRCSNLQRVPEDPSKHVSSPRKSAASDDAPASQPKRPSAPTAQTPKPAAEQPSEPTPRQVDQPQPKIEQVSDHVIENNESPIVPSPNAAPDDPFRSFAPDTEDNEGSDELTDLAALAAASGNDQRQVRQTGQKTREQEAEELSQAHDADELTRSDDDEEPSLPSSPDLDLVEQPASPPRQKQPLFDADEEDELLDALSKGSDANASDDSDIELETPADAGPPSGQGPLDEDDEDEDDDPFAALEQARSQGDSKPQPREIVYSDPDPTAALTAAAPEAPETTSSSTRKPEPSKKQKAQQAARPEPGQASPPPAEEPEDGPIHFAGNDPKAGGSTAEPAPRPRKRGKPPLCLGLLLTSWLLRLMTPVLFVCAAVIAGSYPEVEVPVLLSALGMGVGLALIAWGVGEAAAGIRKFIRDSY